MQKKQNETSTFNLNALSCKCQLVPFEKIVLPSARKIAAKSKRSAKISEDTKVVSNCSTLFCTVQYCSTRNMGAVISSSFKRLFTLMKRKFGAPIVENPVPNRLDVDDFSDDGKLFKFNYRKMP